MQIILILVNRGRYNTDSFRKLTCSKRLPQTVVSKIIPRQTVLRFLFKGNCQMDQQLTLIVLV